MSRRLPSSTLFPYTTLFRSILISFVCVIAVIRVLVVRVVAILVLILRLVLILILILIRCRCLIGVLVLRSLVSVLLLRLFCGRWNALAFFRQAADLNCYGYSLFY